MQRVHTILSRLHGVMIPLGHPITQSQGELIATRLTRITALGGGGGLSGESSDCKSRWPQPRRYLKRTCGMLRLPLASVITKRYRLAYAYLYTITILSSRCVVMVLFGMFLKVISKNLKLGCRQSPAILVFWAGFILSTAIRDRFTKGHAWSPEACYPIPQ